MSGYLLLGVATACYALGIVCQTLAARRTELRHHLDPGLLVRLVRDRLFLLGFLAQVAGFVLTYLARATLPLYLVQASAAAAVGLAAVAGFVVLGWALRPAEMAVLLVMGVGLVVMVDGAMPSKAYGMTTGLLVTLVAVLIATVLLAVPAARLTGGRGAVALGALAGVAFAVLAVACRPVADEPLLAQALSPAVWLVVVSALVGQALMTAGFQRGSATSTAAAMDATSTVIAAVAGLALLGDRTADGRSGAVVVGLVLVVGAVIALAVVARVLPAPAAAGAVVGKESRV